jgi:two-component system sensor histidine kinase QseC
MSPPSIRRTLFIRFGLGVGVLLCLLSAGIYLLVRESLYHELDESIRETAAILANQVELNNESIIYEWQRGIGTNRGLIDAALFQFWDESSASTTRSPALGLRDLPKFCGLAGAPRFRHIRLPEGHRARAVGLRVFPFVLPGEVAAMKARGRVIDPKSLPHILVVARDAEPVRQALGRLRWVLAGGATLTLGLGFVLVDRAIRTSLRPIHELASQVQEHTGHRLDEALGIPDELPSELTGLAKNFDLLLSRVAAIREREKDFIRHAAHELRTPIAGLRATTDLALSKPRDAAAYAGHLATCQKTAVELGELVKRLSALARIGQSSLSVSRETVDLAAFARECLDPFRQRAAERGLTLDERIGCFPLPVSGDPALLRIVCNNLFDNAVSYAEAEGVIRIRGWSEGGEVVLAVANPTVDFADDPERLFEPLFRRESSRHDAGAHLGIGLTLSLEAARAMGGDLTVAKSADGLEFTLAMPAVAVPA